MAKGALSPDQMEVVSEFLTTVNLSRARSKRGSLNVRDAVRFLQPRDFNRDVAIKSYEEFENYQTTFASHEGGVASFRFTGSLDEGGSPLLLLEATSQDLKGTHKEQIIGSLLRTLECLPSRVEACEQSVVVVVNMEELAQFPAVMKDVLRIVLDVYPLLVKTMYVVTNPHLEEVYGKFVVSFLSSSSRKKVKLVTLADLQMLISPSSLPASLGGSHSSKELDWMDMCLGPAPMTATQHSVPHKKYSVGSTDESDDEEKSFEQFLADKGFGSVDRYASRQVQSIATLPKARMEAVAPSPRNGVVNDLLSIFEPKNEGFTLSQYGILGRSRESEAGNAGSNWGCREERAPSLPPKLRKSSMPAKMESATAQNLTTYLNILSNLPDVSQTDATKLDMLPPTTGNGTEEEVKPILPPKQSRVKAAVETYLANTLPRNKDKRGKSSSQKGNRLLTMQELEAHMIDKGKRGLSLEYWGLREEPQQATFEKFKSPVNSMKNRYKDVGCADHTRVQLQRLEGVAGSDYIHANFVDGYNNPRAYIVTQGPLVMTMDDFWRMVFEQESYVIVMITRCVELGRMKCTQYWPEKEGQTKWYGEIQVDFLREQNCGSYILRMFSLKHEDREHVVSHFQFTAWPDYGVPLHGTEVVKLITVVRAQQKDATQHIINDGGTLQQCPPVVVHCSAGIGRSGTYCTIDYCMKQLQETGRVNVIGTVRQLRSQRSCSIQTEDQYEFCYRTIFEYGKTLPPMN